MRDKTVLFVREFQSFSGGHLKVVNYMTHLAHTGWAKPALYLTPDSVVALADEWVPRDVERVGLTPNADMYFVAGLDWQIFDAGGLDLSGKPVINLIQHVRHSHPEDPRYAFLSRQAVRICVSQEVTDAILATGKVNGPVVTISNGLDLVELEVLRRPAPQQHVFIGGLKNPRMAAECAGLLKAAGIPTDLCTEHLPRADYLRRLAMSEISILLPHSEEGFYLPALEAMALGSIAVVPDCIGSRSFCLDGTTCLVPPYTANDICASVQTLLADLPLRTRLRSGGLAMAGTHSLIREREQFFQVLEDHFLRTGRL